MDEQIAVIDAAASSETGKDVPANKPKKEPPKAHRFQKGKSGNPNGRPKKDFEAVKAAQAYGPACIELLARIAFTETTVNEQGEIVSRAAKTEHRITAANSLLDRGYGRPIQQNKTELTIDYAAQMDAFIRKIEQSRELKVIDHA